MQRCVPAHVVLPCYVFFFSYLIKGWFVTSAEWEERKGMFYPLTFYRTVIQLSTSKQHTTANLAMEIKKIEEIVFISYDIEFFLTKCFVF